MNTIGEMFDEAFGTLHPSNEEAQSENKALIGSCLKKKMKDDDVSLSELSQSELERLDAWYQQFLKLKEEAVNLAENGASRAGCEFDALKQKTMKLADEYFSGQDRGVPFAYVAQAFDNVSKPKINQSNVNEKWTPYQRMDSEKFRMVNEIQKFASMGDEYKEDLSIVSSDFMRTYNDAELLETAKANGRLFSKLKGDAYSFGFKKNGEALLKSRIDSVGFPCHGYLHDKIWKSYQDGLKSHQRNEDSKKYKKANTFIASPSPNRSEETANFVKITREGIKNAVMKSQNPNSILNLKPSKKWTIVSDETGKLFENNAFENRKDSGKNVFVLIPEGADLPELEPKWHAVEESLDAIMAVADQLYQSGVGIVGIPIAALYAANSNLWLASVETLLDITLRLLPVDGDTDIELNIEKRGGVTDSNIADRVMHRLSLIDADKAKHIHLKVRFITKDDDCLFNGYADLAAFSWGCGKEIKPMFSKYGWLGSCFVEERVETIEVFRRCLDLVNFHKTLSMENWNILLSGAKASDSLIGSLLRAYGEEAQNDIGRWRTYLNYVLSHLDSKAIRLSSLMPQIAWLKEYEPVSEELPPRLRLLWLSAQLAASNHRGGIGFGTNQYANEFAELSNRLKDEDAPLVCFAALHLAVELTDAYRFNEARSLLQKWENEPIAVPGLRYHARVLSSLGQHSAFLGDNEKALEYFERAVDEFKRLSENWQSELAQTGAYAVIAAIDCNAPTLEKKLAEYLYGGEWSIEGMAEAAKRYSSLDDTDHKYHHAILLRYLVTLPEDNPIRQAYLANIENWKWSPDGHPWELIAFYRALLIPVGDPARDKWLEDGYELCLNAGATLQIIAAVIGAERLKAGRISQEDYLAKVEEAVSMVPAVGESRINALRNQVISPLPAMELANIVLPFNFR